MLSTKCNIRSANVQTFGQLVHLGQPLATDYIVWVYMVNDTVFQIGKRQLITVLIADASLALPRQHSYDTYFHNLTFALSLKNL